jgi:predicted N-acetyltransferase YhbS
VSPAERVRYAAPAPIRSDHPVHEFDCGKPPLDNWLKDHALANEGRASRTYAVVAKDGPQSGKVVCYYALATGSIELSDLPRRLRHKLPNPVPVILLGRLAVDRRHKGAGLGRAMLREAIFRTIEVAQSAGVRALIVHPIDDEAAAFYGRFGFEFLRDSRSMFLPIEDMTAAL